MHLVRYGPLADLRNFWDNEDLNLTQTFENFPLDMYEENSQLVAEVRLPNFNKEDIRITADEDMLEISAEHKESDEEQSTRRYLYRENSNQYLRRIRLPRNVRLADAKAELSEGTLRITMPMEERAEVNEIKVE